VAKGEWQSQEKWLIDKFKSLPNQNSRPTAIWVKLIHTTAMLTSIYGLCTKCQLFCAFCVQFSDFSFLRLWLRCSSVWWVNVDSRLLQSPSKALVWILIKFCHIFALLGVPLCSAFWFKNNLQKVKRRHAKEIRQSQSAGEV